jgi:type III secretion protein V
VLRNGIVDKGYMVPVLMVTLREDASLAGLRVRFLVSEVPFVDVCVARGEWVDDDPEGHDPVLTPGERRRILRGGEWSWVRPPLPDGEALPAGAQRLDERIACVIEDVVWSTSSAFISVHEAQRLLNWADRNNVELHEEAKRLLSLSRITQVIQRLAVERVAVRNAFVILDTLCQWAERERDLEMLTEQVRIALRFEICQQIAPDGVLTAVLLSPQAEDTIRMATRTTSAGAYLALDPGAIEKLIGAVRDALLRARSRGGPVALIAGQEVRAVLRRTLSEAFPTLAVLSYAELTNQLEVTPLTEVGFESPGAARRLDLAGSPGAPQAVGS